MYEWSCSPLDAGNNSYTLPDLGDLDSADVAQNGQTTRVDNSVLFQVPSTLNCSGTVMAVEHCYTGSANRIRYSISLPVFTLLTLKQKDSLIFQITDIITVHSTPLLEICSDQLRAFFLFNRYCCDRFILDPLHQFQLPSPKFAFAIVSASSVNQIRYNEISFPEWRVEQFSFSMPALATAAVGDTFTLSDANRRTDATFRLLKFIISKRT